eukprot:254727-Chlamydomonas_euryale.AAC.11
MPAFPPNNILQPFLCRGLSSAALALQRKHGARMEGQPGDMKPWAVRAALAARCVAVCMPRGAACPH